MVFGVWRCHACDPWELGVHREVDFGDAWEGFLDARGGAPPRAPPPRSVLDTLGASLVFWRIRGSLLVDVLCACLIEPTVLLVSHRFVKEKVRTGSEKKLVMVQTGMVCGSCGS